MPAYFFDSSALVKRFAQEQGSTFVLSLLRPSTKNRLYAARITEVEVCAALARRRKANTINAAQAAKGLRRLRHDLPRRFTQVAIAEGVIVEASRLAETFALRGYDAVQLAATIAANNERVLNGLSPLIVVSADGELNDAARAEGFTVEDPNNYP
jgi:predicted nucleic acid-binding protein